MTRDALVLSARQSIARGSKSFAAASWLFDRETRERAWLLYAWCRAADDLADGQTLGSRMDDRSDAGRQFAIIEQRTEQALAGASMRDPAFDALRQVVAECAIPHHYPRDLVKGFALDAKGFSPADEQDLLRYCYHVAGSVGCMMAIVMGVDPRDGATLDRACDLGIAFQLANIARDIADDALAGRCYLPRTWLDEFGVSADNPMAPSARAGLVKLTERLTARAESYEASARYGVRRLPFRSAWAVLTAAAIYGDIAREVRARGGAAWDRRVFISRVRKFKRALTAAGQAILRARIGEPGRNGLFQRP